MSRPDGLGEVAGQRLPARGDGVDAKGPPPGDEAQVRREVTAGEPDQLQGPVGAARRDRLGAGGGDGLLLARRPEEGEMNGARSWLGGVQVALQAEAVSPRWPGEPKHAR